jgi:hypothetical protein
LGGGAEVLAEGGASVSEVEEFAFLEDGNDFVDEGIDPVFGDDGGWKPYGGPGNDLLTTVR